MTLTSLGRTTWLAAGLAVALAGAAAGAEKAKAVPDPNDIRKVKAVGEGVNKKEAIADAQRNALEQAGKVYVVGKSKTEDFVLVHDTVLARVQGLIKDWKILKTEEGIGGIVRVTIQATVSKEIFDATWAEVENLSRQLGSPTVMAVFKEVLYDLKTAEGRREGIVDRSSFVETQIEGMLAKHGFEVINKNGFKADLAKQIDDAVAEDDGALLQKLAKQAGSHILITGVGNATGPQKTTGAATGITLYNWETDVTLSAYWTAGARTLFAKTNRARGGSRVDGRPGGKQALQNSAMTLAKTCVREILMSWTLKATGGGKIDLIVTGLTFKQHTLIKKGLAEFDKVKFDRDSFKKGVGTYTVTAKTTAEDLAEAISEIEFVKGKMKFSLEIEEVEMGRIKATIAEE